MQINWLPLVQKEKDGRVYSFLLPVGASFDDCIAAALDIIEGFKKLKIEEEQRKEEAKESEKKQPEHSKSEEVIVEVV